MADIYEGMFVLDNEVVRSSGYSAAKQRVADLLEKHGGSVETARHWGERRLAYPIKTRRRATYLLVHYRIPAESIPGLVRDLDLAEDVLRYLLLAVDAVPAGEVELAAKEVEDGFAVPAPPSDEEGVYELFEDKDEERPRRRPRRDERDDDSADDDADGEAVGAGSGGGSAQED